MFTLAGRKFYDKIKGFGFFTDVLDNNLNIYFNRNLDGIKHFEEIADSRYFVEYKVSTKKLNSFEAVKIYPLNNENSLKFLELLNNKQKKYIFERFYYVLNKVLDDYIESIKENIYEKTNIWFAGFNLEFFLSNLDIKLVHHSDNKHDEFLVYAEINVFDNDYDNYTYNLVNYRKKVYHVDAGYYGFNPCIKAEKDFIENFKSKQEKKLPRMLEIYKKIFKEKYVPEDHFKSKLLEFTENERNQKKWQLLGK